MSDIPEVIPSFFVVGDSWTWKRSLSDYPASDGYALKYNLVKKDSSGDLFSITAEASGDDHLVDLDTNDTQDVAAGDYRLIEYVEKEASRFTLTMVDVKVFPNPMTDTDIRSKWQKTLDAIDSVLEGKATRDDFEYEYAGRRLKHYTVEELIKLRTLVSNLVAKENIDLAKASGKATEGKTNVRFVE